MIWYNSQCNIRGQPPDSSIVLRGIYNTDIIKNEPLISVILTITLPNSEIIYKTMYEHDPTMLKDWDPSPEDILARYRAKIRQIYNRLERSEYADIMR